MQLGYIEDKAEIEIEVKGQDAPGVMVFRAMTMGEKLALASKTTGSGKLEGSDAIRLIYKTVADLLLEVRDLPLPPLPDDLEKRLEWMFRLKFGTVEKLYDFIATNCVGLRTEDAGK